MQAFVYSVDVLLRMNQSIVKRLFWEFSTRKVCHTCENAVDIVLNVFVGASAFVALHVPDDWRVVLLKAGNAIVQIANNAIGVALIMRRHRSVAETRVSSLKRP